MKIDSMYEASAVGLLLAAKKKRTEAWMACTAFWLGRQQIFNVTEYWFQLAAKIYSELSKEDQELLLPQLSKQEDRYVSEVKDWPEMPERLAEVLPLSTKKPKESDLEELRAKLLRTVDAEANDQMPDWLGPQRMVIRAEKLAQARVKLENAKVADDTIPYIVNEAKLQGIEKSEMAERIVKKAAEELAAHAKIENIRQTARKAITEAKTVDEAKAAYSSVSWAE